MTVDRPLAPWEHHVIPRRLPPGWADVCPRCDHDVEALPPQRICNECEYDVGLRECGAVYARCYLQTPCRCTEPYGHDGDHVVGARTMSEPWHRWPQTQPVHAVIHDSDCDGGADCACPKCCDDYPWCPGGARDEHRPAPDPALTRLRASVRDAAIANAAATMATHWWMRRENRCGCGWTRAPGQIHALHVAEQLAHAGVLTTGATS